jgi:hypothetical protein
MLEEGVGLIAEGLTEQVTSALDASAEATNPHTDAADCARCGRTREVADVLAGAALFLMFGGVGRNLVDLRLVGGLRGGLARALPLKRALKRSGLARLKRVAGEVGVGRRAENVGQGVAVRAGPEQVAQRVAGHPPYR